MSSRKILGLDLGTTSIGWAYVTESVDESTASSILKLGVRVNPLTTDEQADFEKGKSISINADRTAKRSARRNLQRYKQRRENLVAILRQYRFITDSTPLNEYEKGSTFSTYQIRSEAACEKVTKEELARVFLMINKKRGYKSNRKARNEDEGQAIDGMGTAKRLYEDNLMPGQLCYTLLQAGKKHLPDFYRSDLQDEFDKIWNTQKQFYPGVLSDELKENLRGKNKGQTWKICEEPFGVVGIRHTGTKREKQLELYKWRTEALSASLELEYLAIVLQEINGQIHSSSGYLGAISDRSKELYFNKETVGQYLYRQLVENPHARLKNQVFYRQDYLDEFEKIWETQKQYHPELTAELKEEIRDVIIFYQRKLRSQKGLIGFCEFESEQKEVMIDGKLRKKTIGARVVPRSSPLFQEFKIWQNLNSLQIKNKVSGEIFVFDAETKQMLFDELNIKGNLTKSEVLKLLVKRPSDWDLNFDAVEGNRTNQAFFEAYHKILELEGNEVDFNKLPASEIKACVKDLFDAIGINSEILEFDAEVDGKAFDRQPAYQLWHLLYSFEEDPMKKDSIERLYAKLGSNFGFKKEYARILANISFQDDYGSLSAKAIRKIFPYIKEYGYDKACAMAGYNHSSSLNKDERASRPLQDTLDLLSKNSLRNPVVEKILNQMVNVVNAIIADPSLGRPDEIRLELARELKKNAKQRAEMTTQINSTRNKHNEYRAILQKEFGIKNPTRNDITRYKLYEELKPVGYKTIYSNTYIPREKLFSKEYDIEHIIPRSRLFDDSFSNKTLELRSINIEKGEATAADFIRSKYGESGYEGFLHRVELLRKDKVSAIGKAKYNKLLMTADKIPDGFIDRDLRESQYIAKQARRMLETICHTVNTTTGSITEKLREDWDLVNVMQELNLDKYRKLGLTEHVEKKDGSFKERITDWNKRNDHRHHAMDALTVAFTRHSHVQYLNHLNARKDETHKKHSIIYAIEAKETYKDGADKRRFKPPMINFRAEAKKHLESILVSFKAKNKVVTRNKNKIRGQGQPKIELTPRGQLHKETVYGKIRQYRTKEVKVGPGFNLETINQVAKQSYREALRIRLEENQGDPKKAFGGKNSPAKKPVYTADRIRVPDKVKLVWLEDDFTIRKEISPDLKIEKVIDVGVRKILEQRLMQYDGNAKEAFSNLDENPIWLNEQKAIPVRRVRISGVNNADPLHTKKDHFGREILDEEGLPIPVDYVSTGNNHHVAIFRNERGSFQEEVVSFYKAVERARQGIPVVQRQHEKGWEFLFTMKQNEYFVFPAADFDPSEIDLMDPANYSRISPHLYRVQKIATRDYFFRHHLETNVDNIKETQGVTWKRMGPGGLDGAVKVRINHLGKIVKVGEY